ncbi:MAG: flagellar basal body-associated FliL family protein [Chthoniobacter sp.]|nr:flagellar basal body-associated FliL family protein [Chthoniobacter sp.]
MSSPESAAEAKDGAAKEAKSPNVWMPVIAMLVLMPAITFAVAQFVIIPKMKGLVQEQHPAEGASEKDGHAEPAAKGEHGKPEAKGGHGKSEAKGGHGKGAEGDQGTYDFENVIVNLSGTMGTRYLKASFTVYSDNADLKKVIDQNKKQLLDVATTVLGSRTLADLEQPGAKNVVRNDLMANLNQAVKSDLISQIFFSEFVVQ